MLDDFAARVADQNDLLAAAGIALRLELRGRRIGLRGPLPSRQGGGLVAVQRISLGLPASDRGLVEAIAQLQVVLEQLREHRFDWAVWARQASRPAGASSPALQPAHPCRPAGEAIGPLLAAFEAAFFADPRRRRNPAGSRTTWTAAYRPYLRRLAQLAERRALGVGPELLEQTLESYALAAAAASSAAPPWPPWPATSASPCRRTGASGPGAMGCMPPSSAACPATARSCSCWSGSPIRPGGWPTD